MSRRAVPVYGQYVGQTEAVKTVEVRARGEGFLDPQLVPDGADVRAAMSSSSSIRDLSASRWRTPGLKSPGTRPGSANARQVAARYRPLSERQAVSRQELEQAEADEKAAAATVDTSRAAVGGGLAGGAGRRPPPPG